MQSFFRLLALDVVPRGPDLAVLILRVWLGLTLLINHGLPKLLAFRETLSGFPDPLGLGAGLSLGLATFAEVAGGACLAAGLATRSAALLAGATLAVAFVAVHEAALSGSNSGELAFVYLAGIVAILVHGPGRWSMDTMVLAKGKAQTA